jgi:cell division protein FtsL
MVTVLLVAIIVLAILVVSLTHSNMEIKQQLEAFDREQHNQNMDIIKLMKDKAQHDEMLLQHIEILKYLVEQDPKLNSNRIYFTGPVGEA